MVSSSYWKKNKFFYLPLLSFIITYLTLMIFGELLYEISQNSNFFISLDLFECLLCSSYIMLLIAYGILHTAMYCINLRNTLFVILLTLTTVILGCLGVILVSYELIDLVSNKSINFVSKYGIVLLAERVTFFVISYVIIHIVIRFKLNKQYRRIPIIITDEANIGSIGYIQFVFFVLLYLIICFGLLPDIVALGIGFIDGSFILYKIVNSLIYLASITNLILLIKFIRHKKIERREFEIKMIIKSVCLIAVTELICLALSAMIIILLVKIFSRPVYGEYERYANLVPALIINIVAFLAIAILAGIATGKIGRYWLIKIQYFTKTDVHEKL